MALKVLKIILNQFKTGDYQKACFLTGLKHNLSSRSKIIILLWLVGLVCLTGKLYAATSAGTIITNTVKVSYRNSFMTTNTNKTFATNIQNPVTNLSMIIIKPSHSATLREGETVTFSHIVSNYGNATNTVQLLASSMQGFSNNIYYDTNNNGILDASDLPATNDIRLSPEQAEAIIVEVFVPVMNLSGISSDTITVSGINKEITNLSVLGTTDYLTILPAANKIISILATDGVHQADKLDGTEYLGDLDVTVTIKLLYAPTTDAIDMYFDVGDTPDGSTNGNNSDRKISMIKQADKWIGVIPGDDPEIIHNVSVNIVFESEGNVIYRVQTPSIEAFQYIVRSYQYKEKGNMLNSICYPLDDSKPYPTLLFSLDRPGKVKIEVYDIKGDKVRTLVNEHRQAEIQAPVIWNGKNDYNQVAGIGIYFITLQYDNIREVYKVLVIKK